jgi:hypothetical protein
MPASRKTAAPKATETAAPKPVKASEIIQEIRDDYEQHQKAFLARAARMSEELAAAINHGYDLARVLTGGVGACEPQTRAAVLKGAIARLEGGAVRGAGETFVDRLRDVLEEAEYELNGVIRSRPWESSSTCQVTNVTDRAKLSGRVAANEFLKNRAARYLNPDRFAIVDDTVS